MGKSRPGRSGVYARIQAPGVSRGIVSRESPVAYAQGLYAIGIIREGLPMSREPALLGHRSVSADWSSQAGCRSAVSIE